MEKRLRRIAGPLVTGAFVIGFAAPQKSGAVPLADLPAGGSEKTISPIPNVAAPDAARFAANFDFQLQSILPTLTLLSQVPMNGKYGKFNRFLFRSIGTVNIGSRVKNPILPRDQKVAGHAMIEAFAEPESIPIITESLRASGPRGRETAAELEQILEKLHSNKGAYKLLREIATSLKKRHSSSMDESMKSSLDTILSGKLISNQNTVAAVNVPRSPSSNPRPSGLKAAQSNKLEFLSSQETGKTFAPELQNRYDPKLPIIWFQWGPVDGFLQIDPSRGLIGVVIDPKGKHIHVDPLAPHSLDQFYRSLSRQIQAGLQGQKFELCQNFRRQVLKEMGIWLLRFFEQEDFHPEISVEELTDTQSRFVVKFDRHMDWKYFEGRSNHLKWLTQREGRFFIESLEIVFEDGEALPRARHARSGRFR